jgi:hypothetical protein
MGIIKSGLVLSVAIVASAAVATAAYYIGALAIKLNGWSHQGQVLFTGCE